MQELYHHGIIGQKWGVRRFQNKDGTLTTAGKQRYKKSDGTFTREGKKAVKTFEKNYKKTGQNPNRLFRERPNKQWERLGKKCVENGHVRAPKKVGETKREL